MHDQLSSTSPLNKLHSITFYYSRKCTRDVHGNNHWRNTTLHDQLDVRRRILSDRRCCLSHIHQCSIVYSNWSCEGLVFAAADRDQFADRYSSKCTAPIDHLHDIS